MTAPSEHRSAIAPHRNLRLFPWFNLLMALRFYGPIAILYYAQVSGSYALGMGIFSLATLSQSVFEVPTGIFSDLLGRRRTLILGACVSLASVMAYAYGAVYVFLAVGACLEGLSRALFSGNNDALLHDTLAEANAQSSYADAFGRFSAMFHIGLGLAAVAGGVIGAYSLPAAYWLTVIPVAIATGMSFLFRDVRARQPAKTRAWDHFRVALQRTFANKRLRALSLSSILAYSVGESAWVFRAQFLRQVWPVWALGFAQLIADLGAALGFFFAGRLIRRFGELRLLVGSMAWSELTNLIALLVPSPVSPLLMSMNSVFYGSNNTAMNGLMQREFSDEQRATMGSLTSLLGAIAFSIFSVLFGAFADRVGATSALIGATLLMIAPILLNWHALRPRV
jgi:MFS family permease